MTVQTTDLAQDDLRTLTTVTEYGVRDFSGEIVTLPQWESPADVVEHLHRLGYTGLRTEDVIVRTTTTTTTSTGWEAAS